ncbi:MAG: gfo/Idh/MocA family oxidoreductase, partial [Siphonobacter aquaeclarae]|nr:gfo/Idh/MocA family oxidoreductase [Siphonobacter aquaeclarae]
VMGTEGTIWVNNFLRTGLEMFVSGKGGNYVAEKSESNSGWIFPVGDEVHDLGYNTMFADMFFSMETGTEGRETFYDGYVVNAIMDAAMKSAKTKLWEPVELPLWRGKEGVTKISALQEYDEDHYLVKQETIHDGRTKVIVKEKQSGKISERVL